MTDRISRDAYGLKLAEAAASRADCTRRQVGAVIVNDDGDIVATGYNGAPAGEPGCLSDGACPRGQMSYEDAPAGEGYEETKCVAIHAEVNAVIRAGRSRSKGATIYVTDEPCYHCSIVIRAAGIVRVVTPHTVDLTTPRRENVEGVPCAQCSALPWRPHADDCPELHVEEPLVPWSVAKARREVLGVDVAKEAMDRHPFPTPTRVLATSAIEALIRAGWKSPRMLANLNARDEVQVSDASPEPDRVPRVFTADDPEPTGVAAVRDRDGYVWRLREGGWAFGPVPYTWESITYYAPLTEVAPSGKDTQ